VKKHAPRDVYETREDYRCGVCRQPVERFSAPRARWVHIDTTRPLGGIEQYQMEDR
jgi:hypothetical protein